MKLLVAVEHGTTGAWYGRFVDYLGTHARASDKASLLKDLEIELQYHLNWLKLHNMKPPFISNPELIVSEEKNNINDLGESGGEVALFEFDKQLVTNSRLQTIIQYMTFNRSDLLNLLRQVSASKLEFIPPGKSRNIIHILMHICNAEEWYISRMGEKATQLYLEYTGMPESKLDNLPVFKRLESVRKASIKTLRVTIPSLGQTVFTRKEYTKYPNEKWTTHKILRRFLEHEREHYYNIQDYLGIPLRSFK